MNKERLEELAALQALGLGDEAESKELRDAAARDNAVKNIMGDFGETVASLAYDAPQLAPPPGLKQEILSRLPPQKSGSKIVMFSEWLPYAIAACLMALGVVQTSRVSNLKRALNDSRQNLEAAQAQKADAEARMSLTQLRLVALQPKDPAYATASVTVAWNASLKEGIVALHNLPAPPAGHDYQLWVLDSKASSPRSAGLVNIATTSRQFVAGSVGSSRPGFAISLEPSGGVSAPTGPILFVAPPQEL